jgi:hypothetical protein
VRAVKIAFENVWGNPAGFTEEYFLECFPYLRGRYQFELAGRHSGQPGVMPDVVFYSVYGYVTERYERDGKRPVRVVCSGEAGDHFGLGAKRLVNGALEYEPGFYDYGLTMAAENTHPNHCYFPLMCLHLPLYNGGMQALVRRPGRVAPMKEYFCNFCYSNGNSRRRVEFFHKLSGYRRVESVGVVERNNLALAQVGHGYDQRGYLAKQAFQSRCKFSIAFENTYFPGYTTEKMSDPLVARSVPIYSGNPRIAELFNSAAFINVDEFRSEEEAIEYIAYVDQHDAVYQRYLNAPPFRGNVVPERFSEGRLAQFWERILERI